MSFELHKGEKEGTVLLWTRQVAQVWDELERTGEYTVKREYIEAKNGSITDYYAKLYEWFSREAGKRFPVPKGLYYPIWFSVDEELKLPAAEGTVALTLEIPESEVLVCNYNAWGYRVNYFYVPLNDKDEAAHDKEIKSYGISSDDQLVLTNKGNFFPLLKQKLFKSWERVFTNPVETKEDAVAVTWIIKKEWVKDVEFYKGE